jgi:spermidine/putrescine transport system substrate-binding protein
MAAIGPLLAACDLNAAEARTDGQAQLITPTEPVTWQLHPANPAILPGLAPERDATLRLLAPAGRVSAQVIAGFARKFRKYNCHVQLVQVRSIRQALAMVQASAAGRAGRPGQAQPGSDVLIGLRTNQIGPLVWDGLIQPLNHSYLPHLASVWPRFQNPYYDQGNLYTIPFTVFTTGLAYRRDLLRTDPYRSTAGWALPWQVPGRVTVSILDDYREGIGLGLLASGYTDLSTPDPRVIDTAQAELLALVSASAPRISTNVTADLAAGRITLSHTWSGQAVAASSQLPRGTPADAVGYWFPPDSKGPVGSDTGAVPRHARNPVLAHLFLNHLLRPANAIANFRATGFQPPLHGLTPAVMVRGGMLPPSLISAAFVDSLNFSGLKELPLAAAVEQFWQQAWAGVLGKAHS